MDKKRVLFISQEITPFSSKDEVANVVRKLSQGIQDSGKEIRVFMPKFGNINERRHQLHEVIRLSGLNLVIDDKDHPLIIKVASVPSARMQVYFIDNEEFFKRKNALHEDDGSYYNDNDERSMFFVRGVLETVKKLGWKPDIIHCNGWMTALMPLYIKKIFNKDPHFSDTKVVMSLYNSTFTQNWDNRFAEKMKFDGFTDEVLTQITEPSYVNVISTALKYADGVTIGSESITPDLKAVFDEATCLKLEYQSEETQVKSLSEFLDKVIEEEILA